MESVFFGRIYIKNKGLGMLEALSIALSGLTAQKQRLSATASNVANALTEDYTPLETQLSSQASNGQGAGVRAQVVESTTQDQVDLSREAVDLLTTKAAFKANVAVIRKQDEMMDDLLNVLV